MKVKKGQIYKNITMTGTSQYDIIKVLNVKETDYGDTRVLFKVIKNKKDKERVELEYNISLNMFSNFFKIYNFNSKIKRLN